MFQSLTGFMFRCLVLIALLCFPVSAMGHERLLVFAASSQRDAMLEISKAFEQTCHCDVGFSFAATSTLARQIERGAPAQVFISASPAWMDWLQDRNKIDIDTRSEVISNSLVLISRKDDAFRLRDLETHRFAMADPENVPAGIYGREVLVSNNLWGSVKSNAVYTENVRIAMALVARGNLDAGIVYGSDLFINEEKSMLFGLALSKDDHSPIRYVAAVTREGKTASAFVRFLKSDTAQEIFARFGFLPL